MTELIDDRYELIEVIASGGMASVWRARDVRLNRLVALKRPHPLPGGDESAGLRMDREAHAAAALNHPNVITVYDYGHDESGPFLVMELVEGPTLAEVGRDQPKGVAAEIGASLADALAAIHAAGIVHRDVKPANVIMSERGPLLTDFGIARHPQGDEVTEPGKVVATPSYAAPEVLAGESPTSAADVYSLAVVIAELAAGEPLFNGFERPGEIPDLADPHLAAALRPALSASPEKRLSATELGDALRGLAPTRTMTAGAATSTSSEPTLVMSPLPAPPAAASPPKGQRREIWPWAAAVLAVALLVTFLVGQGTGEPGLASGVTTTTVPTTTSTSMPATTTTTAAPTTTAADTVEAARDRFAAVLEQPPRSELSPREAEDLIKQVDEAVTAAGEGDDDKAEKKLREVAKKVDEKLEGERRDQALTALSDLAALLGVDMSGEGDDD